MKRYELDNPASPNLMEDIFDYESVPKITFDGPAIEVINGQEVRFDPADMKRRDIVITDTTFRDGQQARPPYTVEQCVTLFKLMARLGGRNGVIRQSEFFLYNTKDREAVEKCRELDLPFPEITGWIRAVKGDFKLVAKMGLKETGMLTSSSDYHIYNKLKTDRAGAFRDYIEVVEAAIEAGVRPRCHLEDVTRADIPGFVLPFVQKLADISAQVPEDLKPKVRLCDTMGFGVTYPGAALPRSVPKLVHTIISEGGIPGDRLEWHGHNDFHKAHINGATCWLYGCDAVNTTLAGFGERTGNPPLEGAVMEYIGIKGDMCGIDTTALFDISRYLRRECGMRIPSNQPFLGRKFNATSAGIHADGLNSDERIYNIFNTAKLLKRPPAVNITDKSGIDGVAMWVNNFLGLSGDARLSKIKMAKIGRWVVDQYEKQGRITSISDEEMVEQIKLHLPQQFEEAVKRGEVEA